MTQFVDNRVLSDRKLTFSTIGLINLITICFEVLLLYVSMTEMFRKLLTITTTTTAKWAQLQDAQLYSLESRLMCGNSIWD